MGYQHNGIAQYSCNLTGFQHWTGALSVDCSFYTWQLISTDLWIAFMKWILNTPSSKLSKWLIILHKTVRQQSVFIIETVIVIVQTLITIMVAFILAVSSAVPSTVTMMTKFQTCFSLWLHISVKLSRVILAIRMYIRTCMSQSLENLTVSTHQLLRCWLKYSPDLVLYCDFSEWASAMTVKFPGTYQQCLVHKILYSQATMHSYDNIFKD